MLFFAVIIFSGCNGHKAVRQHKLLNNDWVTTANDSNQLAFEGFERAKFPTNDWIKVDVPHNWDDYGGYRRLTHGNFHGYAWYKKTFRVDDLRIKNKRFFLYFEGVGSYATVWVNGKLAGTHAGGRTTFTLDITDAVNVTGENSLSVRADHPADIRDLPWVCGGCSPEWGFSEGSQPLGIFRPVQLIVTSDVRVEPFGVHIWNDPNTSKESALLNVSTEIKNYGTATREIKVMHALIDAEGTTVAKLTKKVSIPSETIDTLHQLFPRIKNPHLWSLENPYLYTVVTEIKEGNKILDRTSTKYGIRWVKWDIFGEKSTKRFYLNDAPVFINGTAEYEHMLGQGHAFSDVQIKARTEQMMAMGFNSFRDAHQPHNFKYHEAWDCLGILWWPQMAAHIWFDNPDFKSNFKTLLHDWVKERRNSPSVILWGLENESTLPKEFAEECTEIIREMDPTTSAQRLVTTCNGGSGTDWNVIQNWSGTYGGDPDIYDEEISKQLLNGEYGAWRSIDFHSEGDFDQKGVLSEDRMTLLMESKIRLAEKAKEQCCGQYHWLFNSHDNPGRTQSGEGLRDIDRLGPINYKGAVTIWGEPLDVFYMYRSNYIDPHKEPMVYIASHTWPNRWVAPGLKSGIRIYSNCEEVELFNGVGKNSLGKQKSGGIGTHFIFDGVLLQTNVLFAVGYVDGKRVAQDIIVLHHLPKDPDLESLAGDIKPLQKENDQIKTIYRVNCGGGDYVDAQGNTWMADVVKHDEDFWGSVSWTDSYEGLPAFYGSQRQTYDPIKGTNEWPLIQTFRYGRHKLNYSFPVPDGNYMVELYFVEPWYGTGGSMNCADWRIFDVAINDKLAIKDLDIWKESGHDQLLKKSFIVNVTGGELKIHFPKVKSGQAVISAIAISAEDTSIISAPASPKLMRQLKVKEGNAENWKLESWLNTGKQAFTENDGIISKLPPILFGAEWLKAPQKVLVSGNEIASFQLTKDADIFVAIPESVNHPAWMASFVDAKQNIEVAENGNVTFYKLYQKKYNKGIEVTIPPLFSERQQEMYLVAAVPVSTLDKPIDLRKSVTYQAEDGKWFGKAKKVEFMKKTCIHVPGSKGSIAFEFQVGLASKYGLEFRFMSMTDHAVAVDVEIRAADDRLMWSGEWSFLSANVKWQSYRTDTQTTINAGTYTIKITPKEDVPFYFDWVKVK